MVAKVSKVMVNNGCVEKKPKTLWTTLEVTETSGIPYPVVISWIARGLLIPNRRGRKGAGGSHKFSLRQVVGLIVAGELLRSERGCSVAHACNVVQEFASAPLNPEDLEHLPVVAMNYWLGLEAGEAVYAALREKLALLFSASAGISIVKSKFRRV